MKSIAAYRSGLEIDPCVTEIKAEEGLLQELNGIYYGVVQIMLDILPLFKNTYQIVLEIMNYLNVI